ncbi:MAG: polysaccharide deacetylase family protein, partial [Acidimicrobiia bacterium]|nr:polysaccharide deacetylase family protein [Acidimicrobiia bacterium]
SVRGGFKTLARATRLAAMDDLAGQFDDGEVERLVVDIPSMSMLSWEDLDEMSRSGVTVGSHGVHHELHNPAQPDDVLRDELKGSRDDIVRRLQVRCTTLAYPNGDYTSRSIELADEIGYRTAFTTEDGLATPDRRMLALPRISAPGTESGFIRALLAGTAAR